MSGVERIKAAIDKLETLKAGSTPGIGTESWVDDCDVHIDGVGNLGRESWPGVKETAELIVTLNRTIDPQLSILTRAYNMAVMGREQLTNGEVALADAVLGTNS